MKKTISLLTALAMSASMAVCAFAADRENAEPDVIVDGSGIIFSDQNAKIVDGITLVPARGVFEAMGNKVSWDGEKRQVLVTASTGVREVLITIDSEVMTVTTYKTIMLRESEEITLEVPAQIINDRTMIPLRAVSEAFDCEVEWDDDNYAVNITTGDAPLLEGAVPAPKTPVEDMVTMSLSTDAEKLNAGDEFTVYVDIKNIPAEMYLGGLSAAFKYDESVFEYVENSGSMINDKGESIVNIAAGEEVTEEYEGGTRVLFVNIDETNARTTDGHGFKATFKSITGEAGTIEFSNRYESVIGYESYVHFTPLVYSEENSEVILYDGKNLNLIKTPLMIGE